MKVSFCSIAFRRGLLKIEEIIPEIARLGYDGIEIWGNHLTGDLAQIIRIKRLLDENLLEVPMVSPYFNFTGTEDEYQESLKTAKRFIDYASLLGSPLIRAFTGVVGSDEVTFKQRQKCVSALKEITQIAFDHNITIALETHPKTLVDTVGATENLLQEVGAPNLKINLDIYHLFEIHQDILWILENLYPNVVHFHFKNALLDVDQKSKSKHPFLHDKQAKQEFVGIVPLSKGEMDYSLFVEALLAKNYGGYVSVEWFGNDILNSAEQELAYLKTIFNEVKPIVVSNITGL